MFRLYSRETSPATNRHSTTLEYSRVNKPIHVPHIPFYVKRDILLRFYGILCACANSVYQAVFSSPAKNGLGTRLHGNKRGIARYHVITCARYRVIPRRRCASREISRTFPPRKTYNYSPPKVEQPIIIIIVCAPWKHCQYVCVCVHIVATSLHRRKHRLAYSSETSDTQMESDDSQSCEGP